MAIPSDRLDRLRFENIERRRQLCSDVVKGRKRKLSELYYLSRSPLLPITDETIASEDDFLMAFLEKNDLESGHLFDETSLPNTTSATKVQKQKASETVRQAIDHKQVAIQQQQQHQQTVAQSSTQSVPRQQQAISHAEKVTPTRRPSHTQQQHVPVNHSPLVPVERMTTRVSSGAIRHKPVSEILGITPRHHASPVRQRTISSSEVIPHPRARSIAQLISSEEPPIKPAVPLVKIFYSIQASPLTNLVPVSHKALTTQNFLTSYMEARLMMTFTRIDELKREGKWSLRQPQKFKAPKRTKTHWDFLLTEMQGNISDQMRLKKFKIEKCSQIASSIMEYWAYGKSVCVKTRAPRLLSIAEEIEETEETEETDGLIETESTNFNGQVSEKHDSQKPNDAKPKFRTAVSELMKDTQYHDFIDDLPVVPVNRLAMITNSISPERFMAWKKNQEVAEREAQESHSAEPEQNNSTHSPLFVSESSKRGVYIKAPVPPNMKYVEFGVPTIWLPQDDASLLKLAHDFMYNWEVVSANMNVRQSWSINSNIERRTPWECFERWVQLEPNFQISDLRGPYARAAQSWMDATNRAQMVTKRRLVPMGISPDTAQRGQRRLRWTGMFEAIKKSLRKRENAARPHNGKVKYFYYKIAC
ncbi:hypothetical protein V1514DRAFT_329443 [Lipomyces japonicus]|uniref:uncharacterized protein n=1 Tax=Lipomyces japonicus TaxID=56871 RepID=UPI0034CF7551